MPVYVTPPGQPVETHAAIVAKARAGGYSGSSATDGANFLAGTKNLSLVGALNRIAGNAPTAHREGDGVLNQLAGTAQWGENAAASKWAGLYGGAGGPVGAAAYQAAVLASSPVALWPLDDANFTSGAHELVAAKSGTAVGGITPAQLDPWGTHAAASFDGSSGFIYEPTIVTPTNAPFSIELWYQTSTPTGTAVGAFNLSTVAATPLSATFSGAIYVTTAAFLAGFVNGTTNGIPIDTVVSNDGSWHHAVLAYNGTGNVRLYRDGVQVATASPAGPQAYSAYAQMGCSGNAARGGWFNGRLSYVAIYNKLLVASDVTTHFNAR
jgi:hypothetical protein